MRDVKFDFADTGGPASTAVDDFVGIIMYSELLPTGFASSDRVKTVYSPQQSVALGISGVIAQAGSSPKAAEFAQLAYQISETYRVAKALGADNPKLTIGIFAPPTGGATQDFAALVSTQQAAGGKCRVIGIYRGPSLTAGLAAAIQVKATALAAAHMETMVLYQQDMADGDAFTDLEDLSTVVAPNLFQPILATDGGGEGKSLSTTYGKPTGALGAVLGLFCRTLVGNTAMYVRQGNIATSELDVIEFPNGVAYSSLAVEDDGSIPDLQLLEDKGYSYLRKYQGVSGTFINDTLVANLSTSELSAFEVVDLINQARRRLYTVYTLELGAGFNREADGKINTTRLSAFKSLGERELAAMATEGKCSPGGSITIDPAQTFTNSRLEVSGKIRPLKFAKDIHFTLTLD